MATWLLKIFVKNSDNIADSGVRKSYGTFAGVFGIVLNLLLFAFKTLAGILTGAISVIADAFNNLSDAGSSIITLVGFKLAGKKGDKEHPFGHGRMEYIAGLVVSFIIILVGIELMKSSVEKIINPTGVELSMLSIVILVASIAVKMFMMYLNNSLGKKINSSTLLAVAKDSFNDAIATSAVILGLVIGAIFNINIDGILGIIVALFIIYSGIGAVKETLSPLLGEAPNPEFVKELKNTVFAHEEILGMHDLVIHDYGMGRSMISFHAEVDSKQDILIIHDVIDIIEMEVCSKFNCECVIHMDPIAADDEFALEIKPKLIDILHGIDEHISFHDFRYVSGQTHTNLIFDIVVPFNVSLNDEEICEIIKSKIHDINEEYFAVIRVDRDYSNYFEI